MRRYDLVVFDWDGTLMDSADAIVGAIQAAASDMGLPSLPSGTIRQVIGLGLKEAVQTLYSEQDMTFCQQLAERYRYYFKRVVAQVPLFPSALSCLDALRDRQYLLAVATGKSRRGLDEVLQQTALHSYFHATRCADESISKPDPAMLLQILQTLGVSPERALMVGDTEFDLLMASRAGVDSVAVSYGAHAVNALQQHDPVAIIDDLNTLLTIVEG